MTRAEKLPAIPCANCARNVNSSAQQRVYCCDLCSQVADWIRYFRRTRDDGRYLLSDVQDALSVKLAHISIGGYDDRGRSVPVKTRNEVIDRDNGVCRKCGKPGDEIDHIAGSSPHLDNLQLLCHACHMTKTQEGMVEAPPELSSSVHRPIRVRANEIPIRQPSDSTDWKYNLWLSGSKIVSEELHELWVHWLEGPGSLPVDPKSAVEGFPMQLDPWSWYLGNPDSETSNSSTKGLIAYYGSLDEARRVLQDNRQWWIEHNARLDELRSRPIASRLAFRPPVNGRGRWHASYVDVPNARPLKRKVDPKVAPACGNSGIELDMNIEPVTPAVGEQISMYDDRLCGNCLRIAQKPTD